MSDHKYGEPVEDSTAPGERRRPTKPSRAHEGLADAEAASRDVVEGDDVARHDAAPHTETYAAEPAVADAPTVVAPVAGSLYADDPVDESYTPGAYSDGSYAQESSSPSAYADAPTEIVTPAGHADAPTEIVAPAVVTPVVASTPQPIFVQAPEAPRPRGNRAAAGLIGLLAAVAFGILYLAAALGLRAIDGEVTGANGHRGPRRALVVVVLGAGCGLLPRVLAAGRDHQPRQLGALGHLRPARGRRLLRRTPARPALPGSVLAADRQPGPRGRARPAARPLAIVAFVLGRELTIWFGGWVAARGKRMSELNREAQREYERTLEAGPRLHQS
jgi:hypothetical protein